MTADLAGILLAEARRLKPAIQSLPNSTETIDRPIRRRLCKATRLLSYGINKLPESSEKKAAVNSAAGLEAQLAGFSALYGYGLTTKNPLAERRLRAQAKFLSQCAGVFMTELVKDLAVLASNEGADQPCADA